MGKSLYRSYRSTSFDEVVGQDHITTTLKNALKNGSIAHAYLFSGPRGVGKTSVARILAYEINNQKYELENANLDIIEIDAASNRRIDEVREIRDKVHIAPNVGKYKIYIIDEVHMLTKEAFNALLKTLEEPPKHVIFVLATTEANKLPDTIISRCVHFAFKPITKEVIKERLKFISKKEKIDVTDGALDLIAQHSEGSFRDAISLLEQVKYISSKIDENDVILMLGLAPDDVIQQIIDHVSSGDIKQISARLKEACGSGVSPIHLSEQLQDELRFLLLKDDEVLSSRHNIALQKKLLSIPGSAKPKISLELELVDAALQNLGTKKSNHQEKSPTSIQDEIEVREPQNKPKTTAINKVESDGGKKSDMDKTWQEFMSTLKAKNNTLYGVIRMSKPKLLEDSLSLTFKFNFHKKQADDSKNHKILSKLVQQYYGKELDVTTELADDKPIKTKSATDNLQNVSNIFGKTEVLES